MATTTFSLSNALGTAGTQTYLNTWARAIVSMFSACSLSQTTDTGQLDWTSSPPTVVTGTGGTTYGYQIWKFTDSLQTTKPVFLKVSYKQGTTNGALYLTIQVGTVTDGAGNITSTVTATYTLSVNTTAAGYTSAPVYASGDGSYFVCALNASLITGGSTTAGVGLFYIDRSRDTAGAATSEGAISGTTNGGNSSTNAAVHWHSFTSNSTLSAGSAGGSCFTAALPGVNVSMSAGAQVYTCAAVMVCNGKLLPPPLVGLGYYNTDLTALASFSCNISGSAHTYLPLGQFAIGAGIDGGAFGLAANHVFAMRYE